MIQGCLALVGTALVSLGSANAVLALLVTTCTGGDAGNLAGGIITLFLYVTGFAALIVGGPHPAYLFGLLPAALVAAWHSWFALQLTYEYIFQCMSACFAMTGGFTRGDAGEWMDGGEPFYIVLWLALNAVFWIGTAKLLLMLRSRRPAEGTALDR